jgi:hypothetical protein
MKFLPDDYQAPKSSNNYMKLQDGENKIRILSAPIFGWEDWLEKKPIRFRFENKPCKSQDPKKPVRHFWAFIVWNYQEERIQILQLTQATIRNNIEALCKDEDWGDPYFYDIKIIRKGEGVDTEYMVNPLPHKVLNPIVVEAFKESPCNLEALFDSADPFSDEWDTYTPGIFTKEEVKPSDGHITASQISELKEIFQACDPAYPSQVLGALKKSNVQIDSLEKIPSNLFDRIKNAALKKSGALA